MRVVVTGAAGFIGRYLTRALLERGRLAGPDGAPTLVSELVLVDRIRVEPPARMPAKVTPLAGDLRDDGFLAEVMGEGIDSLFHLATSATSPTTCSASPPAPDSSRIQSSRNSRPTLTRLTPP